MKRISVDEMKACFNVRGISRSYEDYFMFYLPFPYF